MPKKEKIIILGSSGQLGSELSNNSHLIKHFKVHSFNRKDCDIVNFKKVKLKINEIEPSYIINCAAYTAVDQAEIDRDNAELVNSTAVENLAILCKKMNITLIHFSTDYVFNSKSPQPIKESSAKSPINFYGLTKHLGEEKIFKNCKKFFLFRISWVYGKYGENFPKKIIEQLIKKKDLKIVNDQFGSPTPTSLISMVVGKILANEKLNTKYGVYHISPDNKCSWFDIAEKINLRFNTFANKIQATSSSKYKSNAKRPKYSYLDNALLKKTFKIKIMEWDFYMDDFLDDINDE